MHIGREYTEWWHHQMQIRDAVGAEPVLLATRWLAPLLDVSMRVLPHTFRNVTAEPGTALVVHIEGAANWRWSLVRGKTAWQLFQGAAPQATTAVHLDPDTAWRLLYHALTPEEAARRVTVEGEQRLAASLFEARSVMV
jgi:hypothetical protein